MQISPSIFVSLVICAAIVCAGCTQPASQVTIVPGTGTAPVIDPAQRGLTQSDLPQGFTLSESRTQNPSDMGKLALDLGWQSGYSVRYILPSQGGNGSYEIIHSVAIYPSGKIPDVILCSDRQARSDSDFAYTDFVVNGLGEDNRAFSGTVTEQHLTKTKESNPIIAGPDNQQVQTRVKTNFSEIIFSKGDTFEVVKMTGHSPDTALLLNLSQKAYSKIP
ncbi:MAG: hypothetical protein WC620_04055 [Methanoregula sp.]|jgi:hypothetical protein